jgi:pSer/pThr/pTyr-binding forkhead associated (FHA) protein
LNSTDLITLGRKFRFAVPDGILTPLASVAWFVGRNPANEIVIEDSSVSEFHARLIRTGDERVLHDLASSGGTFVDGQPATAPRQVHGRELLTFGEFSIRFEELMNYPRGGKTPFGTV